MTVQVLTGRPCTQVDQLADMLSAVFMAHSASQLDIFDHLNTSHAITAAELAVDLFWHQARPLPWQSACHTCAMSCACRVFRPALGF